MFTSKSFLFWNLNLFWLIDRQVFINGKGSLINVIIVLKGRINLVVPTDIYTLSVPFYLYIYIYISELNKSETIKRQNLVRSRSCCLSLPKTLLFPLIINDVFNLHSMAHAWNLSKIQLRNLWKLKSSSLFLG